MHHLFEDSDGMLKRSYSTRRVPGADLSLVLPLPKSPKVGDVLLTVGVAAQRRLSRVRP